MDERCALRGAQRSQRAPARKSIVYQAVEGLAAAPKPRPAVRLHNVKAALAVRAAQEFVHKKVLACESYNYGVNLDHGHMAIRMVGHLIFGVAHAAATNHHHVARTACSPQQVCHRAVVVTYELKAQVRLDVADGLKRPSHVKQAYRRARGIFRLKHERRSKLGAHQICPAPPQQTRRDNPRPHKQHDKYSQVHHEPKQKRMHSTPNSQVRPTSYHARDALKKLCRTQRQVLLGRSARCREEPAVRKRMCERCQPSGPLVLKRRHAVPIEDRLSTILKGRKRFLHFIEPEFGIIIPFCTFSKICSRIICRLNFGRKSV